MTEVSISMVVPHVQKKSYYESSGHIVINNYKFHFRLKHFIDDDYKSELISLVYDESFGSKPIAVSDFHDELLLASKEYKKIMGL